MSGIILSRVPKTCYSPFAIGESFDIGRGEPEYWRILEWESQLKDTDIG
jgi:hypothetical protein